MGYTFTIGNAVPTHDAEYFPELSARWIVEGIHLDEAPHLTNDVNQGGNSRSPSYTVWYDFCKATMIYDIFYDERGHLHAGHPGCIGITKEDADYVTEALKRYRSLAVLPPGFEDSWEHEGPPNYDYHLARLIWLEWWMQWAVKNCEIPAIYNT